MDSSRLVGRRPPFVGALQGGCVAAVPMAMRVLGAVALSAVILAPAAHARGQATQRAHNEANSGPVSGSGPDPVLDARIQAKMARIRPWVDEAKAAMIRGDYSRAERLYRQVLKETPWHGPVELYLAIACERQGRDADAIKAYDDILFGPGKWSSAASDINTHMRCILVLTRHGRWSDAVRVLRLAQEQAAMNQCPIEYDVAFDPAAPNRTAMDALAHWYVGQSILMSSNTLAEDCIPHLEQATKLRPHWAPAQLTFAEALVKERKLDKAEAAYRAALASRNPAMRKRAEEGIATVELHRDWLRTHPSEHPDGNQADSHHPRQLPGGGAARAVEPARRVLCR